MNNRLRGGIAMLLVLAAVPETVLSDQMLHGEKLLEPFKVQLKQALIAGMQEGPVNAITVCSDEAPMIAAALATDDVRIGRTSHRLRNPANKGPDWADEILTAYLEQDEGRSPIVVDLPGDRQGYVEPIMTQALCLACHGDNLASDIAAKLAEAYPDDQATGFELGELRGIFWVEYSAAETSDAELPVAQ